MKILWKYMKHITRGHAMHVRTFRIKKHTLNERKVLHGNAKSLSSMLKIL